MTTPTMEGLVNTRSMAHVDVPRGEDITMDPQNGEAHHQTQLPLSFTVTDVTTTTPKHGTYPNSSTGIKTNRPPLIEQLCYATLFSADMVSILHFNVAKIFEQAAARCRIH